MKLKQLLATASLFACATAAHAQSAGTVEFGAGWIHLSPQSSSDPLEINSVNNVPVNLSLANTGASVKGADTLGLTSTYFITDHIAPEFVFGIPPKLNLDGSGALNGLGKLGTVKQFSPALLLKYYFGTAQQKFRPYLGLGVTRVWFKDGTITNPDLNLLFGGPTTVASIKNSWAPVYNGGLTYAFDKHWGVALSVSYVPLKTTAVFDSSSQVGVVQSTAHIKINPIVTFLNVNYRF